MPDAATNFVLNGPNLDILGSREPTIYGKCTLDDLEQVCREETQSVGFELLFEQPNAEHVLVELIQSARQVGLQFHPESILTPHGDHILEHCLKWLAAFDA